MDRVHGGVYAGQNLTGHLQYLKIVSTSATYVGETGVAGSDLENVMRIIAQKGTVVIMDVEDDTTLHVAMENAGDGWDAGADTVDTNGGSLAYQIKTYTDATAVAVTVGSFRVD